MNIRSHTYMQYIDTGISMDTERGTEAQRGVILGSRSQSKGRPKIWIQISHITNANQALHRKPGYTNRLHSSNIYTPTDPSKQREAGTSGLKEQAQMELGAAHTNYTCTSHGTGCPLGPLLWFQERNITNTERVREHLSISSDRLPGNECAARPMAVSCQISLLSPLPKASNWCSCTSLRYKMGIEMLMSWSYY